MFLPAEDGAVNNWERNTKLAFSTVVILRKQWNGGKEKMIWIKTFLWLKSLTCQHLMLIFVKGQPCGMETSDQNLDL